MTVQLLPESRRDAVRVDNTHCGVDAHNDIGVKTMPDPTRLGLLYLWTRDVLCGVMYLSNDAGVYAIEHPGEHGLRGLPHDTENRERDEKPNDRIGKWMSKPHTRRADQSLG